MFIATVHLCRKVIPFSKVGIYVVNLGPWGLSDSETKKG